MSNNFDLQTVKIKNGNQALRVKAVESALALINTAITSSASLVHVAADEDLISKLADKIEAALNNVD